MDPCALRDNLPLSRYNSILQTGAIDNVDGSLARSGERQSDDRYGQ